MEDEDFAMSEENEMSTFSPPQKQVKLQGAGFSILCPAEIDDKISQTVSDLIEVTDVLSRDDAFIILIHYGWKVKLIEEEWFEGLSVRGKSGASRAGEAFSESSFLEKCPICLNMEASLKISMAGCAHSFCSDCFRLYLSLKVTDEGQGSVETKCPFFQCKQTVPVSLFKHLLPEPLFIKHQDWIRNFFVSSNSKWIKWCPNPLGCVNAIVSHTVSRGSCKCGFSFCWKCSSESHVPVKCDFAAKWNLKNSSESENVSWIIANTKPCPKCRKPIEKNQGCNHMTCSSRSGGCGTEFCWMCLQAWGTHSSSTGGFYSCNLYSISEETEKIKTDTKNALERYMFHFSRFMNHHKSGILAAKELKEEASKMIEKLHEKFGFSVTDTEFIIQALTQVVDCRLVLKWTYVYGYYLGDEKDKKVESKELFEYLQTNLEELTDRLHEYIEKDLVTQFVSLEEGDDLDIEVVNREFAKLRSAVTNQCTVTKNFFSKIIDDLN